MTVCDRCGSPHNLRRFRLAMEPDNRLLKGEMDLCGECESEAVPKVQAFVRRFLNSKARKKKSDGSGPL